MPTYSRRDFAKMTVAGLPLALSALGPAARAATVAAAGAAPASAGDWKGRTGLELFTVRDQLARDYEGTIAKVAAMGYKYVEPVGYDGLSPRQYRALLDRHGLAAPTTHAGVSPGPNLEKTLEGFQVMGIRYTSAEPLRPAGFRPRRPPRPGQPFHFPAFPPLTPDAVKRTVAMYNQTGAIAQKYGIKILVHNHVTEFQLFPNSTQCAYDIILAESDPSLVVMQLDIGWASVAGQNVVDLFHEHPGRFILWHVKDVMDLKYLFPQPVMTEPERMMASIRKLVPVGQGDVDYKAIFANAALAGMEYFHVEQDNAAQWGDSIAAARTSYAGLMQLLT